jgi:hypothetical protein
LFSGNPDLLKWYQFIFLKNLQKIPPDLSLPKGGDRLPPWEKRIGGRFSLLHHEFASFSHPFSKRKTVT